MENKQDSNKAILFLIFAVVILIITIGIKILNSNNDFIKFIPSLLSLLLLVVEGILEYKTNVFKNAKKYKKLVYGLTILITWVVIIIF